MSVTTLCQCWTLTRTDGAILRATDHDRECIVGGARYSPGLALTRSAIRHTTGLAPEPLDIEGALDHAGLTDDDVHAGLWDGAAVRILEVDWQNPDRASWLWSGYLSSIETGGGVFSVSLISQKNALERTIGRVYGRRCDAALGDTRCGVSLADAPQAVCDKRFATCRDVFANSENFRGFPHMPGNDAVIAGPGGDTSGGSRGIER